MIAVRRQFRVYWPFARSVIQRILSYRLNFFMFIAGGLLRTFIMYYLWKAIFMSSSQSSLAGFTLQEMVVYVFISDITARLVHSSPDEIIGEEVKQGSIAINLIRPINYHTRLLFDSLGDVIHQFAIIALPLWIGLITVRYVTIGEIPPSLSTLLFYSLSLVLSFGILFLFNFCFGLLAFYTTNIWGLSHVKYAVRRFLSGELIPILFFPLWAQKVLLFLPFSVMNYTPVMIYLRKYTGIELLKALGIQMIWVMFLFVLSQWLWKKAMQKLTILGG